LRVFRWPDSETHSLRRFLSYNRHPLVMATTRARSNRPESLGFHFRHYGSDVVHNFERLVRDLAGHAAVILVGSNLMTCYAAIYCTRVEPDSIMVCYATPWFSFTYAAACEPESKVYITDQRGSDLCPGRVRELKRR
jgi:hypothetical protein